MGVKSAQGSRTKEALDHILSQIIDEWYERVSPHYLTQDDLEGGADPRREEELKRFHDDKGHRIKFNKHELDFTYGLCCYWEDGTCIIEISVNNKVSNFDYDDFEERLMSHYLTSGGESISSPAELRNHTYREVFGLESDRGDSFTIERNTDRADIMRLSFRVNDEFIDNLASRPVAGKQLIEDYCVSPFRSVYATVYRRQPR